MNWQLKIPEQQRGPRHAWLADRLGSVPPLQTKRISRRRRNTNSHTAFPLVPLIC